MAIRVEKSIKIDKSPEELFRFWRNFENLPRFMNHLESVQILDDKRSHWVTAAPLGTHVEWDAEITDEQANKFMAWRSLEGSDVENSGSVHFNSKADGSSTEVTVTMEYNPPGGMAGVMFATIFGEDPDQQLQEDLYRLKQEIETHGILSTPSK